MVSGSGFVKMSRFALRAWPKILLTAVFFSPIIWGERPRAASAGKPLKRPEKPATLQSAGHRWVHSYRGLMWFENSPLICGDTCVQTVPKKQLAISHWQLAFVSSATAMQQRSRSFTLRSHRGSTSGFRMACRWGGRSSV